MAIQIDLTNSQYGIPFAGAYFRIVTEAQQGEAFLDKCYAWVMTQADMAGSVAV